MKHDRHVIKIEFEGLIGTIVDQSLSDFLHDFLIMLQCALYNIQILTSYAYCYNCLNAYVYIHTHFKMEEFALYNKDVGVYEFQFSFSYSKISRSKKIKILELMLEQKKKLTRFLL